MRRALLVETSPGIMPVYLEGVHIGGLTRHARQWWGHVEGIDFGPFEYSIDARRALEVNYLEEMFDRRETV